ncbi:metal ABC transporter ATP-binding protein [Parapedobacter sp. ISTM3]|uniref:Manganese/zinc/iron transport system ATP-binding protein n=1 Tax=Parapedobacter luteus TaxID=623280 RepID=A0A1T5BG34_9SPHI|nr:MULTISPECIES: metal ABC transporter ATP-binding protein [Parapedobacter]MBK1439524.1 metal ABC transporter ATP-binding protein [Parapedobacter sp. ISTM3]SKB46027.1 manganese/zinc/iron transport system ATP-binding protein [Parapedobacter luteus]
MIIHAQTPVLEVHDLTVTYARKPVLWGVDFTLPAGCIAGIVGPNGAGKSTLLKSIMGLIPVSSGYVRLFDHPLDEVRHRVSYVPQRESVDWDFPVSVLDVVLMGRYGKVGLFRNTGARDRAIAQDCLDKVGMAAFAKRQISQLSGGQQQRVFLARALAQEADLYLMDEPFAGVDAATEQAIIKLLREMAAAKKTIVVVHHDLQSVRAYFDWLVLLNMHLVAAGPTEQVFTEEMMQQAYGGRLSLLSQVSDVMEKRAFPSRED